MRGAVALCHARGFLCDIRDRVFSWARILIRLKPVFGSVPSKKDIIISCRLDNLIIRDVCGARTGPIFILNIFYHSEPRLQSKDAIVAPDWGKIRIVIGGCQVIGSDGIHVTLVIDVAPLGHVLPLFTKSTLFLELLLEEYRECFVVIVDVWAGFVCLF